MRVAYHLCHFLYPAGLSSWDRDDIASLSSGSTQLAGGMVQNDHTNISDIKMLEIIGRGGFGTVYKAFWKGQLVAVKVIEHGDDFLGCMDSSSDKVDLSERRAALLEGAMTSTINHEHVVQTYDYRVVHLNPNTAGHGLSSTR